MHFVVICTFDGFECPIHVIKQSLLICLFQWMVVLGNITPVLSWSSLLVVDCDFYLWESLVLSIFFNEIIFKSEREREGEKERERVSE